MSDRCGHIVGIVRQTIDGGHGPLGRLARDLGEIGNRHQLAEPLLQFKFFQIGGELLLARLRLAERGIGDKLVCLLCCAGERDGFLRGIAGRTDGSEEARIVHELGAALTGLRLDEAHGFELGHSLGNRRLPDAAALSDLRNGEPETAALGLNMNVRGGRHSFA